MSDTGQPLEARAAPNCTNGRLPCMRVLLIGRRAHPTLVCLPIPAKVRVGSGPGRAPADSNTSSASVSVFRSALAAAPQRPTPARQWPDREDWRCLLWQDQLVDRVRNPSIWRRVKDRYRNGAIAYDPDVLRWPWRAERVGRRTRNRAGRKIELQSPWIAKCRLDRDPVETDQRRCRKSASLQHHMK